MARGHRIGTSTAGAVVYEADEVLRDRERHRIVPGDRYTEEIVVDEGGRRRWPICGDCRPFHVRHE